jgi:hypothetical protein
MKDISARYGVMVTFEKPVYVNGLFQGFDGWDTVNQVLGCYINSSTVELT